MLDLISLRIECRCCSHHH